MKLSKAIIKKYGISKKAWQVARGYRTTKNRGYTMAKRKHSVSRKSGFNGLLGRLNTPAMGAIGAIGYDKFISPMIPVSGLAKDALELGVGLLLSNKGGIVGATGKTLVVLNTYQLLDRAMGSLNISGLTLSNSAVSTGGYLLG